MAVIQLFVSNAFQLWSGYFQLVAEGRLCVAQQQQQQPDVRAAATFRCKEIWKWFVLNWRSVGLSGSRSASQLKQWTDRQTHNNELSRVGFSGSGQIDDGQIDERQHCISARYLRHLKYGRYHRYHTYHSYHRDISKVSLLTLIPPSDAL